MTEQKTTPVNFAMQTGLYLGPIGFVIFLIDYFAVSTPQLSLSLISLIMVIPKIAYHVGTYQFARQFKYKHMSGKLSLFDGWNVSVLLYFFASLISGIIELSYLTYFDKTFLQTINPKLSTLLLRFEEYAKLGQNPELANNFKDLAKKMVEMPALTPIQWAFDSMQQSVSIGIVTSLIFGIILSRKKAEALPTQNNIKE
ncbi:MAG: DUF4199 domain-containing protein [Bacteroidota bacterium]|nr:DUF4199 domain-containing protein [Bacteroidota bacterium]